MIGRVAAVIYGLASYFVWLNRSKESLTLDVKRPEATDVLHRLLARADVLVQNLAPGAAEPVISLLDNFEDEVREHISQKGCPFHAKAGH